MPAHSRHGAGYFKVRRGWSTAVHTLDLSSDGARVAVIRLWDKGKNVGGSFGSEAQLADAMGTYRRYIPELREKGWLDGLDIHDWDLDQVNADPTAAERQRRARDKVAARHGHVTPHVTRDVTPPSRPMSPPLTETETETDLTPPGPPAVTEAANRSKDRERVLDWLESEGYERDYPNANKLCVSEGWTADEVIRQCVEAKRYKPRRILTLIRAEKDGRSSMLSRGRMASEEAAHAERKAPQPMHPRVATVVRELTEAWEA